MRVNVGGGPPRRRAVGRRIACFAARGESAPGAVLRRERRISSSRTEVDLARHASDPSCCPLRPSLSDITAQLRAASDPAERTHLTNELAGAARDRIISIITGRCVGVVSVGDIEDAAQELVIKLVALVADGKVRSGGEENFVSRSAANRATDLLRRRGVAVRRSRGFAPDEAPLDDPFATAERKAELAEMTDLLQRALDDLHGTYREVIVAHRFHGVPLKTIAAQWVEDGRAETQAKAEQNVHQAHCRGLNALRRWVERHREEEAP